ncbi:hypothetical protein [Streptomyces rochei]
MSPSTVDAQQPVSNTAGWGSRDVLEVTLVDPQLVVVEVNVDVARDGAG